VATQLAAAQAGADIIDCAIGGWLPTKHMQLGGMRLESAA